MGDKMNKFYKVEYKEDEKELSTNTAGFTQIELIGILSIQLSKLLFPDPITTMKKMFNDKDLMNDVAEFAAQAETNRLTK